MQRALLSLRGSIRGVARIWLAPWSAYGRFGAPRTGAAGWRALVAVFALAAFGAFEARAQEPIDKPPEAVAPGPDAPVPEPPDYRMSDFRSPVPATLRGAKVLTADQAADLWNSKTGAIFIDVYPQAPKPANLPPGTFWRDPAHRSIEGAHWLPNVGYGALSPAIDDYFRARLESLTGGKKDAPLVFFCLRNCWMSWNAAKRAVEARYTNVMWFRDGTDGWQELGYPLVDVLRLP